MLHACVVAFIWILFCRLDLDLNEQSELSSFKLNAKVHLSQGLGSAKEIPLDDEGSKESETKGKYLLAASSLQSLSDWMEAISFWSGQKGEWCERDRTGGSRFWRAYARGRRPVIRFDTGAFDARYT